MFIDAINQVVRAIRKEIVFSSVTNANQMCSEEKDTKQFILILATSERYARIHCIKLESILYKYVVYCTMLIGTIKI